jgi:hypothetical protein
MIDLIFGFGKLIKTMRNIFIESLIQNEIDKQMPSAREVERLTSSGYEMVKVNEWRKQTENYNLVAEYLDGTWRLQVLRGPRIIAAVFDDSLSGAFKALQDKLRTLQQ